MSGATKQVAAMGKNGWAEEGVKLGPLNALLGYHLRRAALVFYPDYKKAGGLRRGVLGVLSVVSANPGINQKTLAKTLRIDTGNMVPLIDELVGLGFLQRAVHAHDRRSRSLTLTRAGKAELADKLRLVEKMEARMLARFSKRDRTTLVRLLERIHAPGT